MSSTEPFSDEENNDDNRPNLVEMSSQTMDHQELELTWGRLLQITVDLHKGLKRPRLGINEEQMCANCYKMNLQIDEKNAEIQRLNTQINEMLKQLEVEPKQLKEVKELIPQTML